MVLVGAGTLLLAAGSEISWLLPAGRFVSGVASGTALAPGSAWIAELSHQDGPGAGARRTTIALSIGFGFGPLVTGLIAQWAPLPELTPYSVHIVLTVIALLAVWNVPDKPGATRTPASSRRVEIRATLTAQLALHNGVTERVYRHQLQAVLDEGTSAMDDLFPHAEPDSHSHSHSARNHDRNPGAPGFSPRPAATPATQHFRRSKC